MAIIKKKLTAWIQLKGSETLKRYIKPTNVVKTIYMPCTCSVVISVNMKLLVIITAIAPMTTVKLPGNAWDRTLGKKCPEILSLLGSRARAIEGIPIVTELMTVKFLGSKGSPIGMIINNTASIVL